ncbi:MAG: SCP2 sterol-binding domain-containing protein [Burkholderiaceae bacterium]
MIDILASQAAVAALNRMLARESWARTKLSPFAGRAARFDVPPFALALQVADGGLFAVADQGVAAVTIKASLAALPLALGDPKAMMRDVRLEGDAEFAQALSFVLQNLRPEPEEELSRFVGDIAAQRLVGLARAALAQARVSGEGLAHSVADYFAAENPMLVTRREAEQFTRDVSTLRDDVERLAKRLERIGPR